MPKLCIATMTKLTFVFLKMSPMVATELLKLAMEMEEGRKERPKKMVANHSAEASP